MFNVVFETPERIILNLAILRQLYVELHGSGFGIPTATFLVDGFLPLRVWEIPHVLHYRCTLCFNGWQLRRVLTSFIMYSSRSIYTFRLEVWAIFRFMGMEGYLFQGEIELLASSWIISWESDQELAIYILPWIFSGIVLWQRIRENLWENGQVPQTLKTEVQMYHVKLSPCQQSYVNLWWRLLL